jgi:hypothetical protein
LLVAQRYGCDAEAIRLVVTFAISPAASKNPEAVIFILGRCGITPLAAEVEAGAGIGIRWGLLFVS